jgi:REP element-mobilizing transposase RayT
VARPPRIQIAGGLYHVTARSVDRRAIFGRRKECALLLDLLAEAVSRFEWECISFCVMTNHYHALIRTPAPNIADGMCRLNGQFAQTYNRRHGRTGHVFERRYHAELIRREGHLLEACRYIALNPVRAGMCDRPEDYEWSSFAAAIGRKPCPPFLGVASLIGLFGTDSGARERLDAFVHDRL